MSYDEIEEIEVGTFDSLSNLYLLQLDNNKLKRIDRKCFESLKSIEKIDISDNDGPNYLSYNIESNSIVNALLNKVTKNGTVSKWDKFLEQFPELGNN